MVKIRTDVNGVVHGVEAESIEDAVRLWNLINPSMAIVGAVPDKPEAVLCAPNDLEKAKEIVEATTATGDIHAWVFSKPVKGEPAIVVLAYSLSEARRFASECGPSIGELTSSWEVTFRDIPGTVCRTHDNRH